MKKDNELWKFVLDRLRGGREVMLLVVAESRGSSPGRAGFKMAVTKSDMCGSIGGGVMEVALVEKARELLESKVMLEHNPLRQVHREESEDSSGMICSGEQTVIIRKISPAEINSVNDCVTSLQEDSDDAIWISPERLVVKPAEDVRKILFETRAGGKYLFVERFCPAGELIIIGGGHCALALSDLMSNTDLRIILYDDRPDLNTLIKNESAHEINIIDNYTSLGKIIESGPNKYVVVMTIGYKYDKVVVSELLNKDFKYFGVLGSKAKMSVLLRELKKEGADMARLDAIHTPIGLNINSRTPFEIAVSIAAEIISVRNKGT